ncbi:MAG TPA: AAA family ATPase [Dehalococcoidia bacterium]|jgi:hypothetical protein|nr:AAA family ATPase [Dehalococcoidia bacterium]
MNGAATPPTLLCLSGPPAVGKMTVGRELCRRTGYKLFHGHVVADALTPYFSHSTPAFTRLASAWRRLFFEEAARAGLNVVTTVAWRFDLPEDAQTIGSWLEPYVEAGGRVLCVELLAPLAVCMQRNDDKDRRRHKNPYWVTDNYLRETAEAHWYGCGGAFPFDLPHLHVDTEHLSAEEAARRIIDHFSLHSTP